MKEKIKRIGALVVFGILVLIMCVPTQSAQTWGSTVSETESYRINIDWDNNATDECFAIWHDRNMGEIPPSEGEELFRIQEDGKVGIGTMEPTNKLDVNGTVRVRDLQQDDTLNDIVVADENGVLHIRDVDTIGGGGGPCSWHDPATDAPPTDIDDDVYTNGKVGIGTKDPVTDLDVNGGFATNIITVTGDYTPTSSDYTILVDASSKKVRIELPPAADAEGQILVIKNINDNKKRQVIIDPDGSETIDGYLTARLKYKYTSVTIQSDGSEWYIIASHCLKGKIQMSNKEK